MAVPTFDRFIEPILRFLARRPDGVPAREAHEAAAEALEIPLTDRQSLVPSGRQRVYKNRSGWAHDRLKRAGYSSCPRRGVWKITEAGLAYLATRPSPISLDEIAVIASSNLDIPLSGDSSVGVDPGRTSSGSDALELVTQSPEDRLIEALVEIRASVARDLLEALTTVTPSYFEAIVLDVLHRMGYGASREDIQRVGGSGDGGIDGIISLDKLGLEKVYVQAKRWQGAVGRPEIQAFYGALAGRRAQKGVFLTTSSYTTQALQFADAVDKIVLIDGLRLAGLMIDHEVGVSLRTLNLPKLDSDYFDEDVG